MIRSIVCVPQTELASRVNEMVQVFVDAERQEASSVIDSELVERLGTSYATVAELVVQLLERQRQVVRLRRELIALRRQSAAAAALDDASVAAATTDATTIVRAQTPVNG